MPSGERKKTLCDVCILVHSRTHAGRSPEKCSQPAPTLSPTKTTTTDDGEGRATLETEDRRERNSPGLLVLETRLLNLMRNSLLSLCSESTSSCVILADLGQASSLFFFFSARRSIVTRQQNRGGRRAFLTYTRCVGVVPIRLACRPVRANRRARGNKHRCCKDPPVRIPSCRFGQKAPKGDRPTPPPAFGRGPCTIDTVQAAPREKQIFLHPQEDQSKLKTQQHPAQERTKPAKRSTFTSEDTYASCSLDMLWRSFPSFPLPSPADHPPSSSCLREPRTQKK